MKLPTPGYMVKTCPSQDLNIDLIAKSKFLIIELDFSPNLQIPVVFCS
jgi:hypothetical protein